MISLTLTLASFAIMLILARLKVPLGWAIVLGSVALGLFFAIPPVDMVMAGIHGVVRPMSLAMLVIVGLLVLISDTMRITGQLDEIVTLARMIFRRPVVAMAALAALIGLLPMPAGALFSAPMVRAAAGVGPIGSDRMSAINYWWRHIWEHWWPLYPGVILAMSLTETSLPAFILYQAPLGVFMVVSGLWIFRGLAPGLWRAVEAPPVEMHGKLIRATAGIWIILIVWGLGAILVPLIWGAPPVAASNGYVARAAATARDLGPLILGMAVSLAWVLRSKTFPPGMWRKIFAGSSNLPLLGVVMSVMIFQGMLERAGAAQKIALEMGAMHFSLVLIVVVLPFVAGMVTGIAYGFVGVSFPILLGLLRALPDHPDIRPYMVLAYACGHLGMMVSPIHLCYVASNQYFETPFGPVYRILRMPLLLMTFLVAAYATLFFLFTLR